MLPDAASVLLARANRLAELHATVARQLDALPLLPRIFALATLRGMEQLCRRDLSYVDHLLDIQESQLRKLAAMLNRTERQR